MVAPRELRVLRVGAHAAAFLSVPRHAEVAAVFARSCYIRSGDLFLCLGGAGIGHGPLNALTDAPAGLSWPALGLVPGMGVTTVAAGDCPSCLSIGGILRLDLTTARLWRPRLGGDPARSRPNDAGRSTQARPSPRIGRPLEHDIGGVPGSIGHLRAIAAPRCPAEGAARHVIGRPDQAATDRIGRALAMRIARLRAWLGMALGSTRGSDGEAPPTDLIGLGPGLTPTGDDVLAGALIALAAIGALDQRDRLAEAVLAEAPERTSALSAAFLRAAADGLPGEAIDDLLVALFASDHAALPALLDRLDRIGHSSGWDMLAGLLLVLDAAGPELRG